MKQIKLLALALLAGGLTGCISPNWVRLVPENKDLDATVNTLYGTITIHSRVNPYGTNGLGPLPPVVEQVPAGTLLLKR